MKKILALFLALSMLLSLLTVPTFAGGEPEPVASTPLVAIPDSATLNNTETRNGQIYDVYNHNGADYLVVRTVEQFLAMDDLNKNKANFVLANDLDFKGVELTPGPSAALGTSGQCAVIHGANEGTAQAPVYKLHNLTLDGNGCALNNMELNFSNAGAGLFPTATWRTSTIKNLTINATCNFTAMQCGILFGSTANRNAADTTITIDNVVANVTYSSTGSHCAALVGNNKIQTSISNTTVNGTFNISGGKNAAFVGDSSAPVTLDNCHVTGVLKSTAGQVGGFIGCSENAVTITDCTADMTVIASTNRTSPFIGQHFANQAVTITGCEASGFLFGNASWNGAFMGVAGGSYNSIGKNPSITFKDCNVDTFIVGADSTAAYVGSNGNGSPQITFKNCTNNATVYSMGSAGAWVAEFADEYPLTEGGTPVESTISVDNECTNAAKIYSVTLFEGDTTAAYTKITAKQVASGEYAYMIAQAQVAKGIDAKYVYGQTIGTNAKPVMGGATVYENDSVHFTKLYTNVENGVETVAAEEKAYVQTTPLVGEGDAATFSTRVVIAIKKDKLVEIASGTISVTFKDEEEQDVKTVIFDKSELTAYYAVWADSKIAEAADGYALIAVTVSNIPVADWEAKVENNEVTNVVVDVNLKNAQSQNIFGTQQQ